MLCRLAEVLLGKADMDFRLIAPLDADGCEMEDRRGAIERRSLMLGILVKGISFDSCRSGRAVSGVGEQIRMVLGRSSRVIVE